MQRGHAPCGALNEKMRGCSSASETPWSGHAKFCEKSSDSPSMTSTATSPSASAADVSIDCVSRARMSGFITSRSTTTSMSCLNFLSSSGMPSSSSVSLPSTFTRVKPSRTISSKRSLNSPLRPRTTGAFTVKRAPSSIWSTWSTIVSIDWPAIGLPQTGQCGRPTRA